MSSGWLSSDVRDPTVAQRAVAALRNGAPGVVVHTGETSQDPVGSLGEALAAVASEVVQRTDVRRLVIAGGDTSGRVVRKLGVTALELLPTPDHLGPGTALCRATSPDPTIDGLHFLLKGGQIGPPTLFETFRTT